MKKDCIRIRGCRHHNLKNIDLDLPKKKICAITGVSGSGKSSLAFDTIYAEGQRRYLECLSPQVKSYIRHLPKPDVDFIRGLSPTLAIAQGRGKISPRITVAMQSDVYDFLRVLYAKIGVQHSPATGKPLYRKSRQEIVEGILKEYPQGAKIQFLSPINLTNEILSDAVLRLRKQGFIRLRISGREYFIEDVPLSILDEKSNLEVVVDRIVMKEGVRSRIFESVSTSLDLGNGVMKVLECKGDEEKKRYYTEIYVCPETGISFSPLGVSDFNFNSVQGACPKCQGRGGREEVEEEEFPLCKEEIFEEEILEFIEKFPKRKSLLYKEIWDMYSIRKNLKAFLPVRKSLVEEILYGSEDRFELYVDLEKEKRKSEVFWKGLIPMIREDLKEKPEKSRFSTMSWVKWKACSFCGGSRLKLESRFCFIEGISIHDLSSMTVEEAIKEMESWSLEDSKMRIIQDVISEISQRLSFLQKAGLAYLELNRQMTSLSQGEMQRVQLASQIGAQLSGVVYVLDEPSIGLHCQDLENLSELIESLREQGNTVLLVEHKEVLLSKADHVVELGKGAGIHGGRVVFQGSYSNMLRDEESLTGKWLRGDLRMPTFKRKLSKERMRVSSINYHNLKDFSVEIPLNSLVGFCGVSGSGKSSLLVDVIACELRDVLGSGRQSSFLKGYESLRRLILVEQKLSGISPRSNPATYVGIMTLLRKLFASTKLAKSRGCDSLYFSLNKRGGGRCDFCEGMGVVRIAMPFMPDVFSVCDVCKGKRYHFEALQLTWENRSLSDVLDMTVEEASVFFRYIPDLSEKLILMKEFGLDYLILGQNFTTLSGGEIQRLKLIAELLKKSHEPTIYILDEPSTGLHYDDQERLVKILQKLVENGHSVLFVEHNLKILKQADWIIELGPGGGPHGGKLLFEGAAKELALQRTPTGKALA